jgi:hypothetical protein
LQSGFQTDQATLVIKIRPALVTVRTNRDVLTTNIAQAGFHTPLSRRVIRICVARADDTTLSRNAKSPPTRQENISRGRAFFRKTPNKRFVYDVSLDSFFYFSHSPKVAHLNKKRIQTADYRDVRLFAFVSNL